MSALRYALVFLGIALGAALAIRGLNLTFTSQVGSSAQLLVPAMIAALIEGQRHVRARRRKFTLRDIWLFSGWATVLAMALNVGIGFGAGALAPEFAKLTIAPLFSAQFNMLLGLYGLGYLLCNRFFAGIGAYNELHAMTRRGEIE